MRRRKVGKEWLPTPWGGRFRDYATLGGVRVPTTGEAYWELPEGRYVYWRARVTSVELFDAPFSTDSGGASCSWRRVPSTKAGR
jgi:hypothetical protein